MKKILRLIVCFLMVGCGSLVNSPRDIYVGGPPVKLYLVNQSSSMDAARIPYVVDALNHQLQNEFKAAWTIDAQILWQDPPDSSYRTLIIKENFSEFPDAWHKSLGFHKIGTLAYVDYLECESEHRLTLAMSHEILEMLTNPNVERAGYECCDPVYPLSYAYSYNGITLSDFVYPAFYNPIAPGPFDHTGVVRASLQPAPGGVLFATLQSLLKYHKFQTIDKPRGEKETADLKA